MKKIFLMLCSLFLFLSGPIGALAADDEMVTTAALVQTKDEFIVKNNFRSTKDINGDLYFVGDTARINSKITGDVIGATATSITVNGTINQNIRVVSGDTINFEKMSAGNITIAAQKIYIYSEAKVNNIYAVSSTFDFEGQANDLYLASGDVIINGIINGRGTIYADHVTISDKAVINGTITVKSPNNITYDDGIDQIDKITYVKTEKNVRTNSWGINFVSLIWGILSTTVIAFILVSLFSKFVDKAFKQLEEKKAVPVLWGLLWFFLIPIGAFLALFTVMGIPVSIIAILVYIILLMISVAFSSIAVGKLLFKDMNNYLRTFIAVILISVINVIPVIGTLAWLTWIGYTFGSIGLIFKKQ